MATTKAMGDFQTRKRKAIDVMKMDGVLEATLSGAKISRSISRRRRCQDLQSVYTLYKELGRGTFGVTRLCKHNITHEYFACKSIPKRGVMTWEKIDAINNEIKVMECMVANDAKNIVKLQEVYEDQNFVHLVMECGVGGNLFDAVNNTKEGHYSEKEAASICHKIVEGIRSCHEGGVLHGDLKLDNILFVTKEADSPIMIIDFGEAKFFSHGELFNTVRGTPSYMAPEVYTRGYSKEADLWSVGVILYTLLCGQYPFQGRSPHDLRDAVLHDEIDFFSNLWRSISNRAKDLVQRLLQRDPRRRLKVDDVLIHPWIQEYVHR